MTKADLKIWSIQSKKAKWQKDKRKKLFSKKSYALHIRDVYVLVFQCVFNLLTECPARITGEGEDDQAQKVLAENCRELAPG